MIDQFFAGLELALRVDTFIMVAIGLFAGMLIGALPGFTTLMAMAILLPVSFFLEPIVGIPFLLGIYKGGIFGGSIPAILVSMPGTGAAIATTYDGFQLTKKGQSRKALDMALFSSIFGDTSSDIFTLLMIFPIALLVMQFGPPELAAILFLSLVVVAATAGRNPIKGLLMMAIGLWFSLIGTDPIGGVERFTFGLFELKSGVPLLPMLIGVFAIPEIVTVIGDRSHQIKSAGKVLGERLKLSEFKRCFRTICRSTAMGTIIGVVPGLGQVVAAMMGYTAAKNASETPENFGKGELEGVAAAEAANNAVNGPTMVPLLTLGIPGDNVTAILLGAFIAQGLRPGPELFESHFARIVSIKSSLLVPLVIMFAVAGSYVFRSDVFDILMLAFFGLFGVLARAGKFDVMPMVMGFILGEPLEYAFGQTVAMADGNFFQFAISERPSMLAILLITPVVGYFLWRRMNKKLKPEVSNS